MRGQGHRVPYVNCFSIYLSNVAGREPAGQIDWSCYTRSIKVGDASRLWPFASLRETAHISLDGVILSTLCCVLIVILKASAPCVVLQATITVEALHQGIDFSLPLSRAKFEELNQDLFKKTLDVGRP